MRETSTPARKRIIPVDPPKSGTKQDIDQTSITAGAPSEAGSHICDLSDIEDDSDDDGKAI